MSAPARPAPRPPVPRVVSGRRRRLWTRLAPLAGLAVLAFAGGVFVGSDREDPRRAAVAAYGAAWARNDFAAMHARLTPAARQKWPLERFARAHRAAATTATLVAVRPGAAGEPDAEGAVPLPVAVRTRAFGTLRADMALPTEEQADGSAAIAWAAHHAFPGLRPGEELARDTRLAPRAALQARDGTVLAEGPDRTGELLLGGADVIGTVGPAPPERAAELARRGLPPDATVGLTGLEREFEEELAGVPGGELRAGGRVLASTQPKPGSDVRSTIDPEIQAAAVTALAGRYGGIAVLRPRTGEVLALAGIAYSAPQPPGSVFKIVTLAGALAARTVKPTDSWPIEQAAVLEGVELENANGEYCGGTLRNAFAHSCNSVFAPMGAELGADKLVAAAERFGFNAAPPFAGAAASTIPPAPEIGDDLAVGSTAIGQGRVLATPLLFASIAGTIGTGGSQATPTLRKGDAPRSEQLIERGIARRIKSYMRSVVTDGTGTAAALPDVKVAGKTGTAELRDSTPEPDPVTGEVPVADTTDTNAWFAAFAPAGKPTVAVAVMLVGAGAGGATAAPAARVVLDAAT